MLRGTWPIAGMTQIYGTQGGQLKFSGENAVTNIFPVSHHIGFTCGKIRVSLFRVNEMTGH